MANGATKVCTRCGLELPLEDFSRCRTGSQGLDARCRRCKAELARPKPEPPQPPDPSPARVLHLELRHARDRGEPFTLAWPKARVVVLSIDSTWSKALEWSQPEWEAAYERRGLPAVQRDALRPNAAA
jgi:hypothetical protein